MKLILIGELIILCILLFEIAVLQALLRCVKDNKINPVTYADLLLDPEDEDYDHKSSSGVDIYGRDDHYTDVDPPCNHPAIER